MEVFDNENYVKFQEFNNNKLLLTNYMHKKCWEDLMDSKKMAHSAFSMLKNVMKKTGLAEEEVITI